MKKTILVSLISLIVLLATSCGSKAEFTLGPLELSPTTAIIGQEVTVSVDVSNIGKAKGIYEAVLNIDGVSTETRSVTLTPGATQTVIFKLIKRETGTYTVKFGDQRQTLTVVKPAFFELTSLVVAPPTAEFGSSEKVKVSVSVTNTGEVEGTYRARLMVDDREIEFKDVTLQKGAGQTVIFNFTPTKAGSQKVAVGELSANLKVYPAIPLLVLPAVGAVMDNGRTDSKDNEIWDFDWEDVPGATKYELYVIGANATIPVINGETNTSSFHRVSGGYIAPQNLLGWKWKVRAYANGLWSEWSEVRSFDVEPANTDPPI